jgi:hypothetical protein
MIQPVLSVQKIERYESSPRITPQERKRDTDRATDSQRIQNRGDNSESIARGPRQPVSYHAILQYARRAPAQIDINMARQRILAQLRSIDIAVKTHEKAHQSVLGVYAMGPTRYVYVRGPDGRFYAVGGSIRVDTQPVRGNPQATIRKARLIRMAALSPLSPSMQDMRIASQAYRMETKAKRELAEERIEQRAERAEEASELRKSIVQKGRLSVLFPLRPPGDLMSIMRGDWREDRKPHVVSTDSISTDPISTDLISRDRREERQLLVNVLA